MTMRLDGVMRVAAMILVSSSLLGACSFFGGDDNPVPGGDAWRTEVVEAIATTPGVTSTEITVHDVDAGTGYTGPLVRGAFSVTGDTGAVVDDALRRASDVLGEESAGVRIKLSVTGEDGRPRRLDELGYPGVRDGGSLWEATH